jgi:flagellar protein FlgJ
MDPISRAANPVSTAGSYAPPRKGQFSEQAATKVAEDFEAFFLGQTLETMFQGIKTDENFGGGRGEDVFRSLQVQEYGKAIAKAGGLGIADVVKREILRQQEVAA